METRTGRKAEELEDQTRDDVSSDDDSEEFTDAMTTHDADNDDDGAANGDQPTGTKLRISIYVM